MSEDRELLEMAAKAAGFKFFWLDGQHPYVEKLGFWNPLRNEAYALRLAVKLKMEVAIWDSDSTVETDTTDRIQENHNGDPFAATCRAIVRAAAEIGMQMK